MDLFNPPIEFKYNYMEIDLKVDTLDNPYIQVVWEDILYSLQHIFKSKLFFCWNDFFKMNLRKKNN